MVFKILAETIPEVNKIYKKYFLYIYVAFKIHIRLEPSLKARPARGCGRRPRIQPLGHACSGAFLRPSEILKPPHCFGFRRRCLIACCRAFLTLTVVTAAVNQAAAAQYRYVAAPQPLGGEWRRRRRYLSAAVHCRYHHRAVLSARKILNFCAARTAPRRHASQ